MIIIPYGDCLFIWRKMIDENIITKFQKELGYKKRTFAADIANRIEKIVFEYGENISETFKRLFSSEYGIFEDYLYKEIMIDLNSVKKIISSGKSGEDLYLFRVADYDNYGIGRLFEGDEEFQIIKEINKVLEGI